MTEAQQQLILETELLRMLEEMRASKKETAGGVARCPATHASCHSALPAQASRSTAWRAHSQIDIESPRVRPRRQNKRANVPPVIEPAVATSRSEAEARGAVAPARPPPCALLVALQEWRAIAGRVEILHGLRAGRHLQFVGKTFIEFDH